MDKNCQDWIKIFLERIDPNITHTIEKKYGIYKFRDTVLGGMSKATMKDTFKFNCRFLLAYSNLILMGGGKMKAEMGGR